jgi:hypothetical protein
MCNVFLRRALTCDAAVTTTGQAATALKLLREKKDQFDLVISDVHMPDMDGFKLLELVGLEMDLPVISKPSLAHSCSCLYCSCSRPMISKFWHCLKNHHCGMNISCMVPSGYFVFYLH